MSKLTREEEDELLREEEDDDPLGIIIEVEEEDDDPFGISMDVEEEQPASRVERPRIPKKKPRSDLEKKLDEAQEAIDRKKEEEKKKDKEKRDEQARNAAAVARRLEGKRIHNRNHQRGRRTAVRTQNRPPPPSYRLQMPRNFREELLDRLHNTIVERWIEEPQRNRDDSPPNRGGMSRYGGERRDLESGRDRRRDGR